MNRSRSDAKEEAGTSRRPATRRKMLGTLVFVAAILEFLAEKSHFPLMRAAQDDAAPARMPKNRRLSGLYVGAGSISAAVE